MQQPEPNQLDGDDTDEGLPDIGSIMDTPAYEDAKYQFPNDKKEIERLADKEFQDYIWELTLDGELALAPGHATAKRVLDLGTGTGIWACNFADTFPGAEVIGVDLSPIQPLWVPTNCMFELFDLEEDWTWNRPFDFIYARSMEGCFSNPGDVINKVYAALTPGGWFEVGSLVLPLCCHDGSVPKNSSLNQWHELVTEAAEKIGRSLRGLATYTAGVEQAGFVNMAHKDFIWPLSPWPKAEKLREIGDWQYVNLDMGLEALSLGLLTTVMGWSQAAVTALCANVRKDLRSGRMHAYWNIRVLYAQKPVNTYV